MRAFIFLQPPEAASLEYCSPRRRGRAQPISHDFSAEASREVPERFPAHIECRIDNRLITSEAATDCSLFTDILPGCILARPGPAASQPLIRFRLRQIARLQVAEGWFSRAICFHATPGTSHYISLRWYCHCQPARYFLRRLSRLRRWFSGNIAGLGQPPPRYRWCHYWCRISRHWQPDTSMPPLTATRHWYHYCHYAIRYDAMLFIAWYWYFLLLLSPLLSLLRYWLHFHDWVTLDIMPEFPRFDFQPEYERQPVASATTRGFTPPMRQPGAIAFFSRDAAIIRWHSFIEIEPPPLMIRHWLRPFSSFFFCWY